ncbi:MAG TPA: 3-dehydroquinate synthase [Rhizomicrobium sp.]|jgi:3-dehydroquinate synthase
MSEMIPVELGAAQYDIHIAPGLISHAGALLKPLGHGRVHVVADENVAAYYLQPLIGSLRQHGIEAQTITLPPGEGTKTFAWLEKLCREILQSGIERDGLIVALGGGVIGDLAGFTAGVLKRGVAYAQIPTTLLAQVDSSVGGKTAIDVPEGKNLIGLFHQPRVVIADTAMLATLPRRELLAGYAEVVKYAALGDAQFFTWLETNGHEALAGNQQMLQHIVAHCCRMKAAIVARDERESGERALLNLGHTFGHALEAACGYSAQLLHGEAVAIGMVLAFRLSERLGHCPPEDTRRITQHLKSAGSPTSIHDVSGFTPSPEELLKHMRQDKKARSGKLMFILVKGIGRAFVSGEVPLDAVEAVLAR